MANSIFEVFQQNATKNPHKTAIICKGKELTYLELQNKVLHLIGYMRGQKLQAGDAIALFLNNGVEYPIIFLAASALNLTLVPLPLTLKGKARQTALAIAPIKLVFAWHSLTKSLEDEGHQVVSVGRNFDEIICGKSSEELADQLAWAQQQKINPELPYILTMTSGSTGNPKPIALSQRTKLNRSLMATRDQYGLTDDEVILTSTPLYHSLAQRCSLLPLLLGATSIILDKYTPLKWLQTLSEYQVSFLFAVSNQLTSILKLRPEQWQGLNFEHLKKLISSSAALKLEAKQELIKKLDCEFFDCYGTSEVGVATDFSFQASPDKLASVGKPLSFVEVLILDDELKPLATGESGQIAVKTQTAFSGYYQKPELTKEAYFEGEYFLTGDIGYLDADNFLYYQDRKKDVIIVGGVNVYPNDIEKVLKEQTDVKECVAVAITDDHLGEKILVAIEGEAESIDLNRVKRTCLEQLTDYQLPAAFEFISEIPRTGLGKIQRNKVKEMFKEYRIKSLLG